MNVRTTIGILTVFVLTLSMTAFAGIASVKAQHAPAAGASASTFYTPSGPSSDAIQMNIYANQAGEYSALAAGQIDLTDVPLTSSVVSTFCPTSVISFLCTGPDSQFSMFEIEFNHANTFYGITDCFAQDGITNGSVCTVPGGTAPNNVPTTATCPTVSPNTFGTSGNCSLELRAFREGIAHLVDKQAMINTEFSVPAGSGITGQLGFALDSPLPPAQGQPHSGLPCDGLQQGSTGTCGSGTFTTYTATTNHATFTLGGVCSWDFIDKAQGKSCVSAESLSGLPGSTDGVTYAVGSADFIQAGLHWVAAGLATAQNPDGTLCEAAPGACFLTATGNAAPITMIIRIDDPIRLDIGQKLATAMCRLFGSTSVTPSTINSITSCSTHINQQLLTIGQAFTTVFTTQACPAGSATNSCPSLGWHVYTGGFGLTEEYNTIWGLYSKQFASNFCTSSAGNAAAGTVIGNDNYFCNAKFNPFAVNVQISSTFANATANLQLAQEFFGNHTGTIQLYDQAAVYAYANGWTGVSDATGFGIAQANPSALLNAWNPTPAASGPTIRWGQKGSPSTYNPYQLGTVIEADMALEVYDSPILVAPYFPQTGANKGLPFLLSYMLDSYTFVTHATDPNCPTTVSRADEPGISFAIAECLKIALRGDIFFHDGVQVTLSDFQFTENSLNATGSLFSGGTVDTGSIVYSQSVLPTSLGGTEAVGQPEVGYVALTVPSVFAVEDLAATPILPQHVWKTVGAMGPCITIGTPQCTLDGVAAGTGLSVGDPAAVGPTNPSLVGSGAFVCASGPLGGAGTVIGQGCTSSGSSSVPAGGTVTLRRFGSGLTPANLAYFRDNANYAQWQWANFDGASTVDGIDISTAASCLSSTPPLTGACLHYDTPARSLTTASGAGSPIGQNSGGDSDGLVTNAELTQIKRWFAISWTDPVAYSVLATAEPNGGGFQPTCGTANGSNAGACAGLFDDGSIYSTPPPPP